MEQEIWKPINDYPGYEVSNYGRVRSYKRRGSGHKTLNPTPKVMNPGTDLYGYKIVRLCNNTKRGKMFSIHRLVGIHFIENPHNLPIIRHMDNNPSNNHHTNLKWGTHKDNMEDMVRSGRQGDNSRHYNITWCLVSPEGHPVATQNLTLFCKTYGLDQGGLHKVVRGQRKTHKGWTCKVCPVVV